MKYENVILSGSLQVSGSLVLPSGPTNPSTANAGDLFFNTTSGKAFGYRDEDGWNDLSSMTTYVPGISNISYFMVAGGGGGGMDMGGGGGAGGVKSGSLSSTYNSGSSFSIFVGAGGAGAPAGGTSGQPSSHQFTVSAIQGSTSSLAGDGFDTISTVGGGYGGSSYWAYAPNNGYGGDGGSGGGTSGYANSGTTRAGGNGTTGQGNNGGRGYGQYYSGGGGGAGAQGTDAQSQPHGGIGIQNSLLGYAEWFGGGGGGAAYSLSTGGNGGAGGGGGGAVGTTTGGAGLNSGSAGGGGSPNSQTNQPGGDGGANTGGGGGGGSHYNSNNKGGNGGSGAVILNYDIDGVGASGGVRRYYNSNTKVAHLFISSGTFTVTGTKTLTHDTLDVFGDSSCVALYQLDGNANDKGGSYNGTASNLTYSQGYINDAGDFNGSNSYIYAANSVQQPTKNFSASVWVYLNSNPSGGYGIVGNFKSGASPQVGWVIARSSADTKFSFWADGTANSNGGKVVGTTVIQTGVWYHVVGTYDGTNVKIYVNGSLENSVAYSSTPGTTDQPLVIGRWYGNYNDYYTDGQIDQVRIFSKALSASEVLTLFNE